MIPLNHSSSERKESSQRERDTVGHSSQSADKSSHGKSHSSRGSASAEHTSSNSGHGNSLFYAEKGNSNYFFYISELFSTDMQFCCKWL